ncbi:MAG: non-heme iron oxygenase ferredoxin subunit [Sphaerobacter sp.]|nr:non-heme iron oxygenase ferredoxin subunit [Sphaerobacter sp.]
MPGSSDDYVRVMPVDEIAEAEIYEFEVDGEPRILTRVGDEIFACDGICTHEYAELAEGEIEDHVVYCPLHGSGFDLRTGAVTSLPAVTPLPIYDVKIEGGQVFVSRRPRGESGA